MIEFNEMSLKHAEALRLSVPDVKTFFRIIRNRVELPLLSDEAFEEHAYGGLGPTDYMDRQFALYDFMYGFAFGVLGRDGHRYHLTMPQATYVLAHAWSRPDYNSTLPGISALVSHFAFMSNIGDFGDTDPPPNSDATFTLYRGASESMIRGLSWTEDRKVAAWSANRSRLVCGVGVLCQAEVTGDAVWGIVGVREFLINPRRLRKLKIIETFR